MKGVLTLVLRTSAAGETKMPDDKPTLAELFGITADDREMWAEYDAAARWCAKRGLTGAIGTALPLNMRADTCRAIDDDPDAFAKRVRLTAYALAMEGTSARSRSVTPIRLLARDAGNRHMRAGGRTAWDQSDADAAWEEFERLWPEPI